MNAPAKRLKQRKNRIRAKINGTAERPRLTVHIGSRSMYLQLIDDTASKTLTALHTKTAGITAINIESATKLATAFAEAVKKLGITAVVFDRNGRKYHGKVKAIADAVRAADITL